jgi:hypothetical protein
MWAFTEFILSELQKRLSSPTKEIENMKNIVCRCVPMSESQFYERSFGATVTFVKDENGKISELVYGMMGREYRTERNRNP